jgi:serine/threonine protein kinase
MSALPTRISRYEIKGLIAQGGMGELYLATDPNTSRLVALKVLSGTLDSSELRGRFEREARALASLNHPNIVRVYDYGEFQGAPFIVMEYVRGETLAEKIKRRSPMSLAHKLKLMIELCGGLAHAHAVKIVHRDVKPTNLMVDHDGGLKILDGSLTLVNMRIGTPGYMSPEQIQGGEIDHRTDIFAVGAVCYELLSNREAFSGANTREVERQVMQAEPPPLATLATTLDPEIDRIITRALAKDPDQRYQNVAELGKALESYQLRLGLSDTAPVPTARAENAARASRASRGEAAYQRALAVYQQDGESNAVRRFAIEALAEDADHAGARELLARLDGSVPAEPTSDQTIFIPRPKRPAATPPDRPTDVVNPTDQTVFIPRANRPTPPVPGPLTDLISTTDPTVFIPPGNRAASRPRTEETVGIPSRGLPASIAGSTPTPPVARTPRSAPPAPKRGEGLRASLQPLRTRWGALWQRRQPPRKSQGPARGAGDSLWGRYKRSALIVLILVVLMAATVVVAMQLTGWFSPSGQLLTITKPMGGTISSAGIRCGTNGSDCSTTLAIGEPVELETEADEGFAFSGFTGDCAPAGRVVMTVPRTCGAGFEKVSEPSSAGALWPLTIIAPKGGTIMAAGDIQCGTAGSNCSANLPVGVPVQLYVQSDSGYAFLNYTGECAPTGNTLMTGPRTCSATFTPSSGPQQTISLSNSAGVRPEQKPKGPGPMVNLPPPPPPQGPTAEVPPQGPVVVAGGEAAPKPITAEEHAKKEIPGVVKEYCAALEALDPLRVLKVYPSVDVRALRDQFRQYKSLKCTIVGAPEFAELDADVGTARVEVGVKQILEMQSGGAPKVLETIAVTTLLRPELRSAWRIGKVVHKPKPKE